MTNTAHRKKLYDDMLGCFTRSNMATNPTDCFSEGANFANKFFSSSDFIHFLENQTTKAIEDLTSAKQLKKLIIEDIESLFQKLQKKSHNIPLLLPHITQYQDLKKRCLPNSFERALEMYKILSSIRTSLLFIVNNTGSKDFPFLRDPELYSQCKKALEILVKLDDNGNVTENLFDQKWQKFHAEVEILFRLTHTAIWYSIRILLYVKDLYTLRNRESTYHNFVDKNHHSAAELFLNDCDQFDVSIDTTAWQSTTSIREIVKEAFVSAGLDYYNPHSFRNTIAQLGYKYCKTPEEFKAWSQNLGHSGPLQSTA